MPQLWSTEQFTLLGAVCTCMLAVRTTIEITSDEKYKHTSSSFFTVVINHDGFQLLFVCFVGNLWLLVCIQRPQDV